MDDAEQQGDAVWEQANENQEWRPWPQQGYEHREYESGYQSYGPGSQGNDYDKLAMLQSMQAKQDERYEEHMGWRISFQEIQDGRGHDETRKSRNQGNFLELLKILASYNDEIAKVVLENAPQNCKCTSHQIQKELLKILSSRVKKSIREKIGDSKFCIVVHEARDESKKEQMALVLRFVNKNGIEIPDLNDVHLTTRFGRSRLEENQVTIQNYFKVEIFFTTLDKQLQELNSRFIEQAMNLLTLSCSLSPKDGYKAFSIYTICSLVEKYYPMHFSDQENNNLEFQRQHFLFVTRQASNLNNFSTIQELCSCLVAFGQAETYFLIDRLLCLILTLPVSTATTERSFSSMIIIKTKLRNKMDDKFIGYNMTIYIEREISVSISSKSIIDGFKSLGMQKALL
ncbi:uncharacterized protein LOC131646122 [Vicia villosa]|uniref:uncharacterized protein LOC131646122 n=1 Tax=Vicia villosa TaxID=3911 RepID=UPI00273C9386|nr:uncharacterized protein LOC131646122 [Vicia villosa]